MGMPSGDSPAHAHAYYQYLQAHQQSMQDPATWHTRWVDLAWMWGFVLVLVLTIIFWVWHRAFPKVARFPSAQDWFSVVFILVAVGFLTRAERLRTAEMGLNRELEPAAEPVRVTAAAS